MKITYFLLVIFVVLLFSCEKKNKTPDENNGGQFLEQESPDNREEDEEKPFSDDSGGIPTLKKWTDYGPRYMTLRYEYDGYWSMRHGEYFRLDDITNDIPPANVDEYVDEWGTGFNPEGPPGWEERHKPERPPGWEEKYNPESPDSAEMPPYSSRI